METVEGAKHNTREYERLVGAADNQGTRYEIKMAALLYLRGLNSGTKFELATNVEGTGAFDDVVFRFWPDGCGSKDIIIFLQLKHKSSARKKIGREQLKHSHDPKNPDKPIKERDFSLSKYLRSFNIVAENEEFCSNMDHTYFILYSNAALDDSVKHSDSPGEMDKEMNAVINTGGVMSFLDLDEIVELCQCCRCKRTILFQKRFIIYSEAANESELDALINQEIIKYYKMIPADRMDITKFLSKMQDYCEKKGKVEYINEHTEIWERTETEIKALISQVQFSEGNARPLGQQVVDSVERVVSVVCPGANLQLRSLKLFQALTLAAGDNFVLVCSAALQQSVLDLWGRGRYSLLALDVGTDSEDYSELSSQLWEVLCKQKHTRLVFISGKEQCRLLEFMRRNSGFSCKELKSSCEFKQLDTESQNRVLDCDIMVQGHIRSLNSIHQNHVVQSELKGEVLSHFLIHSTVHYVGNPLAVGDKTYLNRELEININIKADIFKDREIADKIMVSGIATDKLRQYTNAQDKVGSSFMDVCSDAHSYFAIDCMHSESIDILRYGRSMYDVGSTFEQKELEAIFDTHFGKQCGKSSHLLEYTTDLFRWKKSKGNTEHLSTHIEARGWEQNYIRAWISKHKTNSVRLEDLLKLDMQTFVITGEPGSGKSLLLTSVAKAAQILLKFHWIVRIDLNDITKDLRRMTKQGKIIEQDIISILKSSVCAMNSSCPALAESMLVDSLQNTGNMLVLVDGVDEINPDYTSIVLEFLTTLQKSKISKLWVTSRPVAVEQLETVLDSPVLTLKPITYDQQIQLLVNIWNRSGLHGHLIDYASKVLNITFSRTLLENGRSITRTPLITRMLAEIYSDHALTNDSEVLSKELNVFDLYQKVVNKKCDSYCTEKQKKDTTISANIREIQEWKRKLLKRHMLCSLKVMLRPEELKDLQIINLNQKVKRYLDDIEHGLENSGIIFGVLNGQARFIHRSFAEYFTACWIVENMKNRNIREHIFKLLLKPRFQVVRIMFDYKLAKTDSLHLAVLNNNLTECNIGLWGEVNELDNGNRTALHLAAQIDTPIAFAMVELLLKRGADKEVMDEIHQCTPLYYAVNTKAWETVLLLVKYGSMINSNVANHPLVMEVIKSVYSYRFLDQFEVNWCVIESRHEGSFCYETNRKETIIHTTIRCHSVECLKFLLENGGDANVCDSEHETPLHSVFNVEQVHEMSSLFGSSNNSDLGKDADTQFHKKTPEMLSLILPRIGNPLACSVIGITTEHTATYFGPTEAIILLLNNGSDPNACNKYGDTPLHQAAFWGRADAIVVLLDHGANSKACNRNGDTPLHLAACQGHAGVISLLLNHGADPSASNKDGDTPLHNATYWGHTEVISLLLDHGADLTASNKNGDTPLRKAIYWGDTVGISVLMDRGADLIAQNRIGEAPLHKAVYFGRTDMITLLLDHGSDLTELDNNGNTPLHLAANKGHTEVINLLLDRGADMTAHNKNGNTPLHLAANHGCTEAIRLLLDRGADIADLDNNRSTPLHLAANSGSTEAIRLLLDRDADLTAHDRCGNTPLNVAVYQGCMESIKLLLDHGADLTAGGNNGNTPLILAAYQGHTEAISLLLDYGADVVAPNKEGVTPLHSAAYQGHMEAISLLLDRGADITADDKYGNTPLHLAANHGCTEAIRLLLDGGADITYLDNNCSTPLHLAANKGHTEVINLLLDHGADMTAHNKNGNTPLHLAANQGFTKAVILLLDRGADITAHDKYGNTPLHLAANHGCTEAIRLLLDRGADITDLDNNRSTPLHLAANSGSTEVISLLLDYGADVVAANKEGVTPLHSAAYQGHTEAISLLLDRGANITADDKDGDTPLTLAAYQGHTKTASLLLDCGADLTVGDNNGSTPLHRAVNQGHTGVINLLLDHGVDLTVGDNNGSTPLHLAVNQGLTGVINLLLDQGVDLTVGDNNGSTPLHLAANKGHTEVINLLLDRGADLTVGDNTGSTPLHLAVNKGHTEVINLLLDHGVDLTVGDNNGSTPLHLAANKGHTGVINLLLDHGADLTVEDKFGNTPLHLGAYQGHTEMIIVLLDRGANLTAADKDGNTPLHLASYEGHTETVSLLLDRGTDPRVSNKYGDTPLTQAVYRKHEEVIILLILHEMIGIG